MQTAKEITQYLKEMSVEPEMIEKLLQLWNIKKSDSTNVIFKEDSKMNKKAEIEKLIEYGAEKIIQKHDDIISKESAIDAFLQTAEGSKLYAKLIEETERSRSGFSGESNVIYKAEDDVEKKNFAMETLESLAHELKNREGISYEAAFEKVILERSDLYEQAIS